MQTWSSGPCRIWVGFRHPIPPPGYADPIDPAGLAIEPFGTCERAPEIVEATDYEEWITDLGGPKKAGEVIYAGKGAIVGGILTRYRETVYRRLAEVPLNPGPQGFSRRVDALGDVGTLMIRDRRAVVLWVEFTFGGSNTREGDFFGVFRHPLHAVGQMPPGYRFPGACWAAPTRHTLGTGPKKLAFMFVCHRVLDPQRNDLVLADENLTAIQGQQWEINP